MRRRLGVETEHCIALMEWSRLAVHSLPDLQFLFHIANEGKRSKAAAGIAVAMGLKRGIWDYFLPASRHVRFPLPSRGMWLSNGLWLEMKAPKQPLSKDQITWGDAMRERQYATRVCESWEVASKEITMYLNGKMTGGNYDERR